jgi:hypothetical protein
MLPRSRGILLAQVLFASAVAASGCATTQSMARPAAFPRAPLPPASLRPALPRPALVPLMPDVMRTAHDLRGVSYRIGGEYPGDGFDCSGFIHYVFTRHHIDVPRTVAEQFEVGSKVSLKNVQQGDLVFFSTIAPGATHVGLAVDQQTFIHAPGAGGVVRVERLDTPYWHDRVVGVRRVM